MALKVRTSPCDLETKHSAHNSQMSVCFGDVEENEAGKSIICIFAYRHMGKIISKEMNKIDYC